MHLERLVCIRGTETRVDAGHPAWNVLEPGLFLGSSFPFSFTKAVDYRHNIVLVLFLCLSHEFEFLGVVHVHPSRGALCEGLIQLLLIVLRGLANVRATNLQA